MNLETKVLEAPNEWLIERICQLLNQQYNPQLSGCFIYQDVNYHNYLKKLLHSKVDKFFYCIDSGHFLGFSHFKIANDSIFLNNIIIEEAYKNMGIGKILMKEGIAYLLLDNKVNYLGLDVFKKNERALNWYLKLGMQSSGYKNWYDITTYVIQNATSVYNKKKHFNKLNFRIAPDENGFNQLFYENTPVGTLINYTHLIIRTDPNQLFLSKITHFLKKSNLKSVCLISEKELQFPLIDQLLRLIIPLEELKFSV